MMKAVLDYTIVWVQPCASTTKHPDAARCSVQSCGMRQPQGESASSTACPTWSPQATALAGAGQIRRGTLAREQASRDGRVELAGGGAREGSAIVKSVRARLRTSMQHRGANKRHARLGSYMEARRVDGRLGLWRVCRCGVHGV